MNRILGEVRRRAREPDCAVAQVDRLRPECEEVAVRLDAVVVARPPRLSAGGATTNRGQEEDEAERRAGDHGASATPN